MPNRSLVGDSDYIASAVRQIPGPVVLVGHSVERFGYQRAGMTTVEAASSHLVMLSQPMRVADLIREAVRTVTG
ncbi:hypothetical protein NE236_10195 [Actinoallomurus purpureus]|uniref:hypothetical protein n=1 Tax=Actinoallomurus purpureus TaxID=478114 RepID=UPI002093AABA|nr:hypothetical protein [Actinoallomurus purpureus]MCO6005355.1 hypothetical protein [Actinoallomurus purpureus]